jgi:bifunctional enzyme CysN/CysC
MPWYQGSTLLHRLETVKTGVERNKVDFRFPVQYVIRPNQDYRGFAGQVASGTIRPGEEVVVLPSNRVTRVAAIDTFDGEQEQAGPGDSITITLDDEIDASRGSMIVRARNRPEVATRLDADLCWMSEEPMRTDRPYVLQHTSREVQALVDTIVYRINMNTLHREEASTFRLNEIGRVELATSDPLFFDAYNVNRATGSFILIDPDTNATVAAGMIRGGAQGVSPVGAETEDASAEAPVSPNVVWEGLNIDRAEREAANGHRAAVLWLTGLSGAGKSTIAREVEQRLFDRGIQAVMLDGDHVRHGLCGDLGFSPADRQENVRRVGEVARLFFEQGNLTLCTFVSPYQRDRDRVRDLLPEGRFVEIFVEADIETLKKRDPKGLYEKALAGEIINFTGITAPYEAPADPELVLNTEDATVEACAERLIAYLEAEGLVPAAADTDA